MVGLIVFIVVFLLVTENSVSNITGKKYLKTNGDVYCYLFVAYSVAAVISLICACFYGISLFSLLFGIFYGFTMIMYSKYKMLAFSKGQMHITTLIVTSSMIMPTVSGAVLYGEHFSVWKMVFIVLLIFFAYLSAKSTSGGKTDKKWVLYLIVTFLFTGGSGIMQKIHQSSVHKGEIAFLLACAFTFNALYTYIFMRKTEHSENEIKTLLPFSVTAGICYFATNYFCLMLAGILPSQICFPLENGSAIVLSAVVAVIVFKEKLTTRQIVGIIGGVISLCAICIV